MGRPPQDDVERYSSGRKKADYGTPEARERKIAALGRLGAESEQRTGHPIDLIWARGLILAGDHKACTRYAGLYARVEQPRVLRSQMARLINPGGGDLPEPTADDRADYNAAEDALERAGTRARSLFVNIVIYAYPPRFLDTARRQGKDAWLADMRDLNAFRSACDAVAVALSIQGDKHETKRPQALSASVAAYYRSLAERIESEGRDAEADMRKASKKRRRAA